jgi:hypothetical protein
MIQGQGIFKKASSKPQGAMLKENHSIGVKAGSF